MSFVTLQGASSQTFNPPPTDGSLTLVEIFDYNALHSPNHPLFRYEGPVDGALKEILWSEAVPAIHKASRLVRAIVSDTHPASRPVIAILASMDSLTYFLLLVGIMRAGFIPFPISLRNSAAAVTNLLIKTECKYWYVSDDIPTKKLADTVTGQLNGHQIKTLEVPTLSELFSAPTEAPLPPLGSIGLDQPCIIQHSSGSTSLPKPITVTQGMVLPYGYAPYFGDVDYCGLTIAAHGLPMSHMMGFLPITWSAMTGLIVAYFTPSETSKPPVPSPVAVMSAAINCKCKVFLTVPAFLEAWAKDPRSVEALQGFASVQVSGGPIQNDTGDFFVKKGVNLVFAYGMTEIGVGTVIVPKKVRKEGWPWMKVSPHTEPIFLPVPDEDNLYRLVYKKCKTHTPAVLNTSIDGVDAFDTNDLVRLHPDDPLLFTIHGRDDEQITHSTGEKTNPTPIEELLERDPKIFKALMFGRSKFQAGVLIMPVETSAFDPQDTARLAEFRNEIWDTIAKANEDAPRHSRIFKEMIIVSHPGKPFEFTPKGTKRRQAILNAYETEINAAYTAVDEISQPGVGLPESKSLNDVTTFVRSIVQSVISPQPQLEDGDDLFSHGGDSLSATAIRSSILLALRKSKQIPVSVTRTLPANFAYDFPTIKTLSAFVYGVLIVAGSGGKTSTTDVDDDGDDEIFDWGALSTTSTIVKLRVGKGEPPLIVIHGVAGSVIHFKPFQEKFRSALWAIQVTPDTPLTSFREQAAFYYQKIKEEQPNGPYRLVSFSASSFLVVLLTLMFEANGDKVTQMAMLDYFPTTISPLLTGLEKIDATDPHVREHFLKQGLKVVDTQLRQDDGGLFPNQREAADQIRAVSEGKESTPAIKQRWDRMKVTLLQMLDFLPSITDPDVTNKQTVEESMTGLRNWMRGVKAPVSVYVASNGMIDCLPEEVRDQWKDLGTRECYPNAEVFDVKGSHFGMLADDMLVKSLQNGYI